MHMHMCWCTVEVSWPYHADATLLDLRSRGHPEHDVRDTSGQRGEGNGDLKRVAVRSGVTVKGRTKGVGDGVKRVRGGGVARVRLRGRGRATVGVGWGLEMAAATAGSE